MLSAFSNSAEHSWIKKQYKNFKVYKIGKIAVY